MNSSQNFGKLALKQAKDYGDAAFVDMVSK
jgi:hypothetical protein